MVHRIPCRCSNIYIRKTTQVLEISEDLVRSLQQKDNGDISKSRACTREQIAIEWKVTRVLDHTKEAMELFCKQALDIQMTPAECCFNPDITLGHPTIDCVCDSDMAESVQNKKRMTTKLLVL